MTCRSQRWAVLFSLFFVLIHLSCSKKVTSLKSNDPLANALSSKPDLFGKVLQDPGKYRLQILYTQIDRDASNQAHFRSYSYRLNNNRYFYPASTVKLPAAILALEKLNNLDIDGLDKFTHLRIDSASAGQTSITYDSTAPDNLPSIAHYIKKILLVSDNDAYNRLYEFLGQRYLNETLWRKGYTDTKIIRRLSVRMPPSQNAATNPVTFYSGDDILYEQPLKVNPDIYKIDMLETSQGIAHYSGGRRIGEPIDFSHSNYISAENLQNILKAILFPDAIPEQQRFNLSEDDYRFLYKYMSLRPRESDIAAYQDTTEYYDCYVKYFICGDSKEMMPAHIRILNKVGQAYGYLIDNAYIIDFENRIEFLLTAVIQVNENQTYNDNEYEYDWIGYPFLANLGRVIYDLELNRERKFKPDLKRFQVISSEM